MRNWKLDLGRSQDSKFSFSGLQNFFHGFSLSPFPFLSRQAVAASQPRPSLTNGRSHGPQARGIDPPRLAAARAHPRPRRLARRRCRPTAADDTGSPPAFHTAGGRLRRACTSLSSGDNDEKSHAELLAFAPPPPTPALARGRPCCACSRPRRTPRPTPVCSCCCSCERSASSPRRAAASSSD